MENIYEIVARQIDRLADGHVRWSACASREQMEAAFRGRLVLSLGIDKPVPSDWLAGVSGRAVLCLAGAGGLWTCRRRCWKKTAGWLNNTACPSESSRGT